MTFLSLLSIKQIFIFFSLHLHRMICRKVDFYPGRAQQLASEFLGVICKKKTSI